MSRGDIGPEGPATSLGELLGRIRPDQCKRTMSVREIVEKIGERSFTGTILVTALILVSPVSGIPGSPTVGSLIIVLVTVQALIGRDHLWLPDFLMRRQIGAERLRQGLRWLREPAAWIDRHSRDRWQVLVTGPLGALSLVTVLMTAITWPALELLPFFTSFAAGAVSLFAIELLIGDGLYIVAGYATLAAILAVAGLIWQGLV